MEHLPVPLVVSCMYASPMECCLGIPNRPNRPVHPRIGPAVHPIDHLFYPPVAFMKPSTWPLASSTGWVSREQKPGIGSGCFESEAM